MYDCFYCFLLYLPLAWGDEPKHPPIHLKAKLKKIPGLVRLVQLGRILASPGYRSEWLLRRAKPDNLFQPIRLTRFDRYPRIFSFVKDQLSSVAAPRLLSFGCSTGEEVFTLRGYFPQAEIIGIDINPRSIAICRKRHARSGDNRIRFELASSAADEPESYYDAIFCMAVLRHGDVSWSQPENCAHLICFDDFEKTVVGLSRVLKPGGFLIILHSNFRFADTSAAAGFDVALVVDAIKSDEVPLLYDRNNQLLVNGSYSDTVFRKREIS